MKMKIDKWFYEMSVEEYIFYIDNHKKYEDFNTLGLYRSITENDNLTLEDQIKVRDYAHRYFKKSFDFLQVKDAYTFFHVSVLGKQLSKEQANNLWNEISENSEKILKKKRIKHRNFGVGSKHECISPNCPLEGMMIQGDSYLTTQNFSQPSMHTLARTNAKAKAKKVKRIRKDEKQIIKKRLEEDKD